MSRTEWSAAKQAGKNQEECFATINGCRLRFLRGGEGPPVVLAHGLGGYSFCFRHNLAALAEHYTVYAPDFPGSGYSDAPGDGDGGVRGLAKTLLSFIRELDLKRPAVIGSSHGGAVALTAASLAQSEGMEPGPIELGPMVLAAPVNPWSRWGAKRARMLGKPVGAAVFRAIAPLLKRNYGYFVRRMYGEPKLVTPETVAGYVAGLRGGAARNLLARVKNWEADLRLLEQALPACANLPILLIWGERDSAVDPASAQHLLRALPRAQLAVMRGAGHLPFEEQPQGFNRLALDFLTQNYRT